MTDEEHFRRLEQMYAPAPCNAYYASRLTVSRGRAEVTFPVREGFLHAARTVHGSVYFKALDDAAYFACSSLVKEVFLMTASFTIHMTRAVSEGELRAVGQAVHVGGSFLIGEAQLYDGRGREVARGSGTFVRTRLKLAAMPGYGP